MNIRLTALGIVAALSFAGCETTTNTNVNRAIANSNNAVVVNANNSVLNTNTGVTNGNSAVSNTNRNTVNYNGTVKENETQRTSVENEAKQAGRSIGSGANDWWLWGKTRASLAAADDLRDSTVDVDVDNATVTLTGTVANAAQKAKAEQVAKAIEGVKSVKNNLKVNAGDTALPNVTNSNTNKSTEKH